MMLVTHRLQPDDIDRLNEARVFFAPEDYPRLRPGDSLAFDESATAELYAGIFAGDVVPTIGAFSYCWSPFSIHDVGIVIGRYCSMAGNITMMPGNHAMEFVSSSPFSGDPNLSIFRHALVDSGVDTFAYRYEQPSRPDRSLSPRIGHDVWIGQHVTLARGITIGTGAVIGAASMVTKSVPPYAIIGGNPARLIRMRFPDNVIEALLASEWWDYSFTDFSTMSYHEPLRFVDELQERVACGMITKIPEAKRLAEILQIAPPIVSERS